MERFRVDIDTDAATFKVSKDGMEIFPEFFTTGCYKYSDTEREAYISFDTEEDSMRVTRSAYFIDGKVTANVKDDNLCKTISSMVRDKKTAGNIASIFSKKKTRKATKAKIQEKKLEN